MLQKFVKYVLTNLANFSLVPSPSLIFYSLFNPLEFRRITVCNTAAFIELARLSSAFSLGHAHKKDQIYDQI